MVRLELSSILHTLVVNYSIATPAWVSTLIRKLRESAGNKSREAAATLLEDFIYCSDLAGDTRVEGQPGLPTVFEQWQMPAMAVTSDHLLSAAMALLEGQCANTGACISASVTSNY